MIFDDFLGLANLNLDRYRLLVFQGDSGSGKSTALDFVSRRYETERDTQTIKIESDNFSNPARTVSLARLISSARSGLIPSKRAAACVVNQSPAASMPRRRVLRSRTKLKHSRRMIWYSQAKNGRSGSIVCRARKARTKAS